MKKLFASMLVVLSVFFVGNTANAAPWVNLGYYDGAQCRVDKGSYVIGGTINQPKLRVRIDVNYEDTLKEGRFVFCEIDGEWQYICDGSKFNTKGDWKKVSSSRLANDILYVILH